MNLGANSKFLYNNEQLWKINTKNNFEWCKVKNQNQLLAQIPVHIRKKASFRFLIMPIYTPYIDIELFEDIKIENNYTKFKYEKRIYTELIKNLPKVDYINIRFKPGIVNLLPFYWQGFTIKTRYTYLLETSKSEDEIFDDFHPTLKKQIKKAESELLVNIENNIPALFDSMKGSFSVKNDNLPSTANQVKALTQYLIGEKHAVQYVVKNNKEEIIASILFAFDSEFVDYYLGGVKAFARTSGATSLLLWEGIKLAKSKGLTFNFEGSMIPDIEKYFRKFGGKLTPFYEVEKFNNKLLKAGNVFSDKL